MLVLKGGKKSRGRLARLTVFGEDVLFAGGIQISWGLKSEFPIHQEKMDCAGM